MDGLFRKIIDKSLERVLEVHEEIKKTAEEFVEKNKEYEEKGQQVVDEFKADWKKQQNTNDEKVKAAVDKVITKFDIPTKSEIEKLKQRLNKLEEQI